MGLHSRAKRISPKGIKTGDKKIFGAKRQEETARWQKLRDEEFHALYSSPKE
jgi:hypothetical protein